jgi:FtsZ-binding cell division protein ZapB
LNHYNANKIQINSGEVLQMKYLLVAVLLSVSVFSSVSYAEQQILFCTDTYKYGWKTGQKSCGNRCDIDCGLNNLLQDKWKIDATTPKEIIKENWWGLDSNQEYGCTCVGTQYVLSKAESNKVEAVPDSNNIALLNREIELLKKENDMLKQENTALKAKSKKKNKTKKTQD